VARVFALLLVGSASGCASALASPVEDPMAGRAKYGSVVRLTVQNRDFKDASVYAIWRGGTRHRVGLVTGKTSATFSFEWVSDEVAFEADFVGGGSFTVESIDVS